MKIFQNLKSYFTAPEPDYSTFVSACCGAKWTRQVMVLDLRHPYGGTFEGERSRRVCTNCGMVCDLVNVFVGTEEHE